MTEFQLASQFQPAGDQPQAIEKLIKGLKEQKQNQVLLGVTGSGKTFTMANVIANTGKPTLILSHNKTLTAQLYGEFKEFFPDNAVEYFVSYYDYYQPEAYIPRTDTYIEKDSSINEQIDRMRHSATRALLERPDVVIVAPLTFTPLIRLTAALVPTAFVLTEVRAADPSLSVILPRGAQRGTEQVFRFAGARLNDAEQIFFYEPGFEVLEIKAVEKK